MDQSNSKLGLTLFASGSVNSTAGLNVNTAGAQWHDGIFIKQAAVNSTAIRLAQAVSGSYTDLWHVDSSGNEIVQNINVAGTLGVAGAATIGTTLSAGAVSTTYEALLADGNGGIRIGATGTPTGQPYLDFWGNSVAGNQSIRLQATAAGVLSLTTGSGGGGYGELIAGNVVAGTGLSVNNNGSIPTTAGPNNSGAGLGFAWNLTGGNAESDMIAYRTSGGSGGFAWYDYVVGSTRAQIATMSSTGALSVPSITLTAYTSSSIGGSSLSAGTCASTMVSIAGLASSMVVDATPTTYPGDAFFWKAYASAAGTATVKVCAVVAGTPTASVYNIRVLN
jgi:hypothetical protein